ncbi:MAG: excinuclease ABC subunit UvrC [Bacteroidales bacterium]
MSLEKTYTDVISELPGKPGVYMFVDTTGVILYVGKARDLKKRVSSYFSRNQSGKTIALIRKATSIRHIVVDSESDALLLENNLIKKYQPRYNILLKDDKTYPWICIKNEPFPRVFSTRNVYHDGSAYFGPYTSGLMVRTLITLIRQLFQLRTCNYKLDADTINSGKLKVCLEYHIGNCKAPCIRRQEEKDYNESIAQIRSILKGNTGTVIEYLNKLMSQYATELKFEEAQKIKEKLELLARYRSKSTIVNSNIGNLDVYGFTRENETAYVNYLRVTEGAVIQTYTLTLQTRLEEGDDSLLGMAVAEIRQRVSSDSPEILVPFLPDVTLDKIRYTVPEIGDKKKLLDLATRNAVYFKLEQKKRKAEKSTEARSGRNLEKVMKDLHMPALPVHIECFDNSNIMGTNPVAACVVFRNGKPSPKDYRHFNIKSVEGPDDFSSMEEVVFRRYRRLLEEGHSVPQLIIIDGGKGQLSSAVKSLSKLELKEKVTIIGIAKKLEEIYFPGDSVPIYIDKNSYTLKLIQHLRNEAHRFGINFHRDKRSAGMLKSVLDEIKGIGPKTKEMLLKKFDSVAAIREADRKVLVDLIGESKARKLLDFFTD